tara:strand:+ start:6018 stop:6296 length:279 start_codon:yes stop_codon:yes gene_type:complete
VVRLFFYLIPIVIAIFIFFDLKKIGRSSIAFMVASACAFLFPIAPLIYLALRPKLKLTTSNASISTLFCSRCGHSYDSHQKKCSKCGNQLVL